MQTHQADSIRRAIRSFSFATVLALVAGLAGGPSTSTFAATVTLRPARDTTLYDHPTANLSNGAGAFLFAGSSGEKRTLRSLVAFATAGQIPAGSTITAVTLTLGISTPLARNANTVRLHRLSADWGEGTSIAPMGGGGGAPATNGDATWVSRFFNTSAWTTPGGDFSATVSASQAVSGATGNATFSTTGLVADVQAWVNNPSMNFGWILVAQDETGPAVRFSSREGVQPPTLVIDFTPPGGAGGNSPPAISSQPSSQSVPAGSAVTFTVVASGTPAPAFQWRKDGSPITGATNASLTLVAVSPADAGTYSVVVTNLAGTIPSQPATLTVTGGATASATRLSNLSVRAAMSTGQTLIVGFSVSGGSRAILVRGVGPTLASLGLDGTMADPRLELYAGNDLIAQNDDWGSSAALAAAFSSVGAFPLQANSRDAALLQSVDGSRSVQLKGTGAGVALVELYDTGSGNSPRLVNVSARNQVGTGDRVLIFGFFVDGTGTKSVLIRAIGPRLADLGVTGVLSDPKVDVFRAGTSTAITSNDNWDVALASTFSAVGAFDLIPGSRDAALLTTLGTGSYTVQVSGANGSTGEALVEIYEVP